MSTTTKPSFLLDYRQVKKDLQQDENISIDLCLEDLNRYFIDHNLLLYLEKEENGLAALKSIYRMTETKTIPVLEIENIYKIKDFLYSDKFKEILEDDSYYYIKENDDEDIPFTLETMYKILLELAKTLFRTTTKADEERCYLLPDGTFLSTVEKTNKGNKTNNETPHRHIGETINTLLLDINQNKLFSNEEIDNIKDQSKLNDSELKFLRDNKSKITAHYNGNEVYCDLLEYFGAVRLNGGKESFINTHSINNKQLEQLELWLNNFFYIPLQVEVNNNFRYFYPTKHKIIDILNFIRVNAK